MKFTYYAMFLAMGIPSMLCAAPEGKRPPNIVLIYADDLGYGELGVYGQKKIQTPNIDRLAKEGMKFTQHYTGAPLCSPARCILLTGKNAGQSYIRGNYELGGFEDDKEGGQMPLPEGIYTLPKMLKQAGYTTGMSGKWGLGMNDTSGSPLKQGFDYYFGYLCQKQAHNYYPSHLWENDKKVMLDNPPIKVHTPLTSSTATDKDFDYFKGKTYAAEEMTKKGLAFLDKNSSGPFFLYMPYTLPHVSLQAPDKYINMYKDKFDDTPYYGDKQYASTKYPRATYAAMITYLDDQVGLVAEKIKQLGLDDNTLIMFSSDNGPTYNGGIDTEFFDSVGGLRGKKTEVFEGGIRMPFIARWHGHIPAGKTSDLVFAQYDIMPTLAELTGQSAGNTNGISVLPELLGKSDEQKKHDYLYWEIETRKGQVAVRMGDWKGIRRNVAENKNAPWLLFNLKTDRNEKQNVAADHPEIIKRLDEIAAKEHQAAHIREWEFINPKYDVVEKAK